MIAPTTRAAPVAVRCGLVHVSIARVSSGWAAMAWGKAGPYAVSTITGRARAEDHARAYAASSRDRVLDLPGWTFPEHTSLIHVEARDWGSIEVLHESRSGESFACLGTFDGGDLKRALVFALDQLPVYGSRLGRITWAS